MLARGGARRRRWTGPVWWTLAAVVLVASPALAQSEQDDGSGLSGLKEHYDEAVAEEAQLLADYDATVARVVELDGRIGELNESIAVVESQLLAAERDVQVAEDALHVTEIRLGEVQGQLDEAEQRLHDQAVDAYIFGGNEASTAAALLRAETLDEYRTSRIYARAVIEDQDRVVEEFLALRDEAGRLRDDAARSRDAAASARDDVARHQAALVADRGQVEAAQAEASRLAIQQEQLISEVQARKADYQLRIAVLEGTSDSITELLQRRQQGQSLPADTVGIFGRPVPGAATSGYGPRLHPIFGVVRQHNGLDLDAGLGEPVVSSEAGVVVAADSRGGYGNVVVVDHGNALATVYAHLSSFAVSPGMTVQRDQVLGGAGSTGFSTGPHLHWEVRVFGVPVDPVPYLEK